MVGHVYSVSFQGVEVLEIAVQVQTSAGLPAFHIVGLGNKAVAESREGIKASFHTLGLALPAKHIIYPTRVQLVAAMNPCRCGYYGDASRECARVPRCAQDYQNKISGPLIDRFDIFIDAPEEAACDLVINTPRERSANVAVRVAINHWVGGSSPSRGAISSESFRSFLTRIKLLKAYARYALRKELDIFSTLFNSLNVSVYRVIQQY
jgi:hypothetical protein